MSIAPFKIAAAQFPSASGDIKQNISTHCRAIHTAAEHGIAVLIFPELSLTGYDLKQSARMAISPSEQCLTRISDLAREHQMHVVVGVPLRNERRKPYISSILFDPSGERSVYHKMHQGGCEPTYFSKGESPLTFTSCANQIGVAICADSSRPTHPESYAKSGASIYATGVFLKDEWYSKDAPVLSDYASEFGMLVVMANHGASEGEAKSVGKSRIWDPNGSVVASAEGNETALVVAQRVEDEWYGEVVTVNSQP